MTRKLKELSEYSLQEVELLLSSEHLLIYQAIIEAEIQSIKRQIAQERDVNIRSELLGRIESLYTVQQRPFKLPREKQEEAKIRSMINDY